MDVQADRATQVRAGVRVEVFTVLWMLVEAAISIGAVVVMPLPGVTKRRLAVRLDSGALRGDAASSFTCGYMATTVLLGVGLNALFHWQWAEDVAALIFLFWLVGETREAFEEARKERDDEDVVEHRGD